MNNTVKILLTINLEGGTFVRKDEQEFKSFYKNSNGKIKVRMYKHAPLEAKECTQRVQITTDSYDYMVSDNVPEWSRLNDWKHYNKQQRLEKHLSRFCHDMGGKSFTYEILED